jgi:hypothetical protein
LSFPFQSFFTIFRAAACGFSILLPPFYNFALCNTVTVDIGVTVAYPVHQVYITMYFMAFMQVMLRARSGRRYHDADSDASRHLAPIAPM